MSALRPRKMTPEACADFLDWWAAAFNQEPAQLDDPDPLLDLVLEGERRDGPTYFSRHQLEQIGQWFLQHREQARAQGEPLQHEALFASLFELGEDGELQTAVGVHPLLKRWETAEDAAGLFTDLLSETGAAARPDSQARLGAKAFQRLMNQHQVETLALTVLDQALILRDGEDLYRVPMAGDDVLLAGLSLVHPLELGQSIEARLERLNDEIQQLESFLGDRF